MTRTKTRVKQGQEHYFVTRMRNAAHGWETRWASGQFDPFGHEWKIRNPLMNAIRMKVFFIEVLLSSEVSMSGIAIHPAPHITNKLRTILCLAHLPSNFDVAPIHKMNVMHLMYKTDLGRHVCHICQRGAAFTIHQIWH